MFPPSLIPGLATVRALALAAGVLATALPAAAHPHAHTHGHMDLAVAIDAQTVTLALEGPLDGFLGFERAPRNDAERKRVADMVARLKAADGLFQPDAAAGCRLQKVELDSAVLGLRGAHGHGHDHDGKAEHADIAVDIVFTCTRAAQARFIDAKPLFEAYPRLRSIDVQVAAPQKQFRRTLGPRAARLDLAGR
ncbi:DUF2796 domain-containing protein [Comamonas endophytica]|uniref:DUF2796 domain-containing protein n=1 Tax=Comamonas endophytica TaxID=2949090 RepID=A0ABY6GCL0_9BURK|nr:MULTISPECIES: DUF2796 domain-containing protein [unclassified Acidovorax]MCD2512820.1 DUF2796 domain-containing protein [Acidovorax sp. D4N7]UYG52831.1 DUF2796 domain-containing protein [Acidovorax sp. 5MLIR]